MVELLVTPQTIIPELFIDAPRWILVLPMLFVGGVVLYSTRFCKMVKAITEEKGGIGIVKRDV